MRPLSFPLDRKFKGALLANQLIRNRAINKTQAGFTASGILPDLVFTYEVSRQREEIGDQTTKLITDLYTTQLKIKKAELEVLLDAAKDPSISLVLKQDLLRRALAIYESIEEINVGLRS